MHVYAPSLLICILFILTVMNIGLALIALIWRGPLDWLRVCLSIALGIGAVGLLGLVVWLLPFDIHMVALSLLIGSNGGAFVVNLRRRPGRLQRDPAYGVAIWVALSLSLLTAVQLPIQQPGPLRDGPYVYKRWTLPVRLQLIPGDFPADNALPAYVAEYMARKISFAAVHPVMPGQEVANRPVLQALVFLPFRAIFTRDNSFPKPYPSFTYVGQTWPDTSPLISDKTFANFLAVAIPCNAVLILGVGGMLALFAIPYLKTALIGFGVTSPYFITHTFFTWPKNLAAFFILVAIFVLERRTPSVQYAAFLMALAFWSHPYAIGFGLAFCLAISFALAARCVNRRLSGFAEHSATDMVWSLAVFALTLAPWYVWTLGVLHQSSDMISQNGGNSDSLIQALWVRMVNLAYIVYPIDLVPQFSTAALTGNYLSHLVSAIGFIPLLVLPVALVRQVQPHPVAVVWLGLIPAAFVVGVFGVPFMVPMYHGFQAVWPMMLAASLALLCRESHPRIVPILAILQIVVNLTIIALRIRQIA